MMQFTNEIRETLVSRGITLARPKDTWTIAGDFRVSDEITHCSLLYFVAKPETWVAHAKKYVDKLFPGLEYNVDHMSWSGVFEGISLRITPVQPPASFGFIQLWASLGGELRQHVLALLKRNRNAWGSKYEWPEFGYAITSDMGVYLANENGDPIGNSLVFPHVRFLFLLLRGDPKIMGIAKAWKWAI